MSAFINELTIMGNVGRDPELNYLPNGDKVTKLSIATSEKWIDHHNGEEREETEWHTAQFFRGSAEVVCKYIGKGDKIWLRGKIRTNHWIDKSTGQQRTNKELIVREMKFITIKGKVENERTFNDEKLKSALDFENQNDSDPSIPYAGESNL